MSASGVPKYLNFILTISILSVAISPILVRLAGNPGLDFAFWRSIFSALLLLPFAFNKRKSFAKISPKDAFLLGLSGILLGVHFYTWILSLSFTSVASSTVIVTATPIFVAILGWFWLKEKLNKATWIGIMLGFLGTCLLAYAEPQTMRFPMAWWGNLLSFFAMICIGIYLMIGRKLRKHMPWVEYVFCVYAAAALTTILMQVGSQRLPTLEGKVIFWSFIAALFPSLIGHGGMNYAIKFHHPAFLSLLVLTEPLLSSLVAFFIWEESPNRWAMLGMSLIMLGVAYPILRQNKLG